MSEQSALVGLCVHLHSGGVIIESADGLFVLVHQSMVRTCRSLDEAKAEAERAMQHIVRKAAEQVAGDYRGRFITYDAFGTWATSSKTSNR